MVIKIRNRRNVNCSFDSKEGSDARDSPVPSLRSSSSSLTSMCLESPEGKSSSSRSRGFRWMVGAAVTAIVFSLLRSRRFSNRRDNSATEELQALYRLSLPTNQHELITLNDELATLDPESILQWAHHHLYKKESEKRNSHYPIVQATSFGPTGLVILDQLSKCDLLTKIPVITMDTLHLFRESYAFYETVKSYYRSALRLTVTKPMHKTLGTVTSSRQFQDLYGSELWKTDPKTYTKLTKLDPMQQKLEEWRAVMWITGRRRSQGGERVGMDVLEFEPYATTVGNATNAVDNHYDLSRGRWKLNPLAYWSYEEVWSYIRKNGVPYNPLYDQGYTSIGDEMTTSLPKTKTLSESDSGERSGRFSDFVGSNRECGLHVDLDMDLVDMELEDDEST